MDLFKQERPDIVVHLAAQAGVRYSIENPRQYLESNINGTFELLEAARAYPPRHMLLASTHPLMVRVRKMPYKETSKADHQLSFYAATKKINRKYVTQLFLTYLTYQLQCFVFLRYMAWADLI